MNESNKIALLEDSQTIVTHDGNGEKPLTALLMQTDTQVVNHRLYINANTLHEATGLSKSEVREHLANAPQDKIANLNNQTYVRLPTAMKWNQTILQSSDPTIRARGQAFQSSAHSMITEPGIMKARAISAASVTKKSNHAKVMKRRELKEAGQDNICQLSLQPINGQDTHMHHRERIADKPELAAEMNNLALTLIPPIKKSIKTIKFFRHHRIQTHKWK
ncbi:hypothetical protein QOY93_18455 [Leclercia adecarboxylata]|uniref:hypothetical protein n=1 Tax=Leclercia adecarboxylata TaxID=83655 RepID=UPI00254F54CE|nr:hypothetical protein [Leclercia adecarboxylata]MDK4747311.1 hypothetical protein [Leclercia adecarboxylata]